MKTVKFYDVFALEAVLSGVPSQNGKVRGVFLSGRFFYGVVIAGGQKSGTLAPQDVVADAIEIDACETDPDNFPRTENSTLCSSPVFDDAGAFMGFIVECSQRKS